LLLPDAEMQQDTFLFAMTDGVKHILNIDTTTSKVLSLAVLQQHFIIHKLRKLG